ncbi:DUF5711 family protein [Clostridium sp. Cult2]|uniref:DUF5711 family protein n=1 Tax=Clostridium sp. Cult2 TaxID=2079003 RepID=UPI001F3A5903|nr:DUF5711 family protein [Clostridium sp. Cult2]MCF6466139.1 hypothetical protein [Clostridium sp. Cult2]
MNPKQKKNTGFKFLIIIFIGIILLFSRRDNQEKFINFIKTSKIRNKELKLEKSIPIDINIDQIAFYDGSIVVWGDNKLRRLKLDGNLEWQKEFNIEEPMAYFGEEGIFICERSMGQVYSLNPKGETIEKFQLNGKVYNIDKRAENILVHIKEGDREVIKILDSNGQPIGEKLVENHNILTYSIGENNKRYALSTLNLKGENLKSEIQTYGLEGEFLWTASLDNEIVLYTNFIDEDNLIVLSDKGMYLLNDGNILWKKQFQLIKDINMDEENIHILHGNILETISFDGRTVEKKSFIEEYKKIIPFEKYLILYGNNYIIGLKEGEEVFKYKSEDSMLSVTQGAQKLFVVYKNKIDIILL